MGLLVHSARITKLKHTNQKLWKKVQAKKHELKVLLLKAKQKQ